MDKTLEILNQFSASRQLALINAIGGPDACKDVLARRKRIILEDVIRKFVDKHGRFIPFEGMQSSVSDADYDFNLQQPKLDYGLRLAMIMEILHCGPTISAAEFQGRSEKIIARVKANKQLSNLLKGVYLPIVLPQMEIKDYGQTLEENFLPAVERVYKKQFPG
jgi:hypothetical protein